MHVICQQCLRGWLQYWIKDGQFHCTHCAFVGWTEQIQRDFDEATQYSVVGARPSTQESCASETHEEMSLRHALERKARRKVCPKCGQNPYDGHAMCSGEWQ